MKTKIDHLMGDCHMNRIILYLYFGGKKSKTEIYRNISTNPRMPKKLEYLENEGYITVHQEGYAERPRNMIELTPLGNTLAEGLCELEQNLGGDLDSVRFAYRSGSSNEEIKL